MTSEQFEPFTVLYHFHSFQPVQLFRKLVKQAFQLRRLRESGKAAEAPVERRLKFPVTVAMPTKDEILARGPG